MSEWLSASPQQCATCTQLIGVRCISFPDRSYTHSSAASARNLTSGLTPTLGNPSARGRKEESRAKAKRMLGSGQRREWRDIQSMTVRQSTDTQYANIRTLGINKTHNLPNQTRWDETRRDQHTVVQHDRSIGTRCVWCTRQPLIAQRHVNRICWCLPNRRRMLYVSSEKV